MKRAFEDIVRKALEKGVLKIYELDTFGGVVIG